METIIPILLALAIFGLQAYANFQKEQEKARKRNPAQGRPSGNAGGQPAASGTPPRPAVVSGERLDEHRTPSPQQWQPDEVPATANAFDAYSGRVDAKKATQRVDRHTPERLEVTDTGEMDEESRKYSFDLREAVIQSAVLERPYQ